MNSDQINIILLEFFVDNVKIDKHVKGNIPNFNDGKVCVLFKFLDFPPLQICEEEETCKGIGCPVFKSGRSGLFSVPEITDAVSPDLFQIDIYVLLKFKQDDEEKKVPIGQTTINITNDFAGILVEARAFPHKVPVSRTLRESYLIADGNRKLVGTVSVFIRASCFGNMIVQQFARAPNSSACAGPTPSQHSGVAANRGCGPTPTGATTAHPVPGMHMRGGGTPVSQIAPPPGAGLGVGVGMGPSLGMSAGGGLPTMYPPPGYPAMPPMGPLFDPMMGGVGVGGVGGGGGIPGIAGMGGMFPQFPGMLPSCAAGGGGGIAFMPTDLCSVGPTWRGHSAAPSLSSAAPVLGGRRVNVWRYQL